MGLLSNPMTGAAAPAMDATALEATHPEAFQSGVVTFLNRQASPGYLITASAQQHFDDEREGELLQETRLRALDLLSGFLRIPDRIQGTYQFDVQGMTRVKHSWADKTLKATYFVPLSGISPTAPEPGSSGNVGEDIPSAEKVESSDTDSQESEAAKLYLEAGKLRKQGELDRALEVLGHLSDKYPLSPYARRSLKERFKIETLRKKAHMKQRTTP